MAAMLSLLDVLPRHERVSIGGGDQIDVYGISVEDIAKILERYPDVFGQMVNIAKKPTSIDPRLLGALVAASQRTDGFASLVGNEEVEARARALSIGAQMKVMQALGRCTFPDGVGPFLEDLKLISSAATEVMDVVIRVGSKAPSTESRPMPKPSAAPSILPSGS
jgi:hypothetical protein